MRAAADTRLQAWLQAGILNHLDLYFAGLMGRLDGRPASLVPLAAALVSRWTREGHICLELERLDDSVWEGEPPVGELPPPAAWIPDLRLSKVVGRPGERRPLVLDEQGRLYLFRYWEYETRLGAWIRARAAGHLEGPDPGLVAAALQRLFGPGGAGGPDWQQVAAITAVFKPFCVISGGPGTGKTTTVARILTMLLELAGAQGGLRIALAAPTGKAAARLQEAVGRVRSELNTAPQFRAMLPGTVATVHRLLGVRSGSPYFRHNAENPLRADVVVVDEASMLDLALLCKLTQAIPDGARLILLGDRDQLASVEAGAVLGDICGRGRAKIAGFSSAFGGLVRTVLGEDPGWPVASGAPGLGDCIVQLRRNYRFGAGSGLADLSAAVNQGDGQKARAVFRRSSALDLQTTPPADSLPAALRDAVLEGYGPYLSNLGRPGLFKSFEQFRILCVLREGPYGVANLNRLVRVLLAEAGLVTPSGNWYPGRPVMITRNDYRLRLFNGDVGIALPDLEGDGGLRVFFPGADGQVRGFHPLRLPPHITVYAMTVHKAQGSEFDRVSVILPDRDNPLLTRELIYTAVTRARSALSVLAQPRLFDAAVSRCIERASGLREALWGEGALSPPPRGQAACEPCCDLCRPR